MPCTPTALPQSHTAPHSKNLSPTTWTSRDWADFPIYKSFRFKGSIGPLRLHLVGAGAFARLRAAMGCPVPMPRVLREERLLAVIQGTVIS